MAIASHALGSTLPLQTPLQRQPRANASATAQPAHAEALPDGDAEASGRAAPAAPALATQDTVAAPALRLGAQLAEDFATYDRNPLQPGLWAVVAHRLGVDASRQHWGARKLVLEAAHRVLSTGVDLLWGIHLPRAVRLGRRVRIWHSGCMFLNAREIGDDVHLRHETTFGPLRGAAADAEQLPVIEARVELGAGVSVLGNVRVGHDSFVGANSLVIKSVSADSVVLGVPARQVPR